jgi:DNA-binding NarL/FixJ family response regulator
MATLLLVDDHPLFREGFAQMMRALRPDWSLRLASSADEARAALDGEAGVDLVVIDINLPDGDGFGLCEEVRARRATQCVLISGREDDAARIRARASGACGLIAKSSSPEDIVAMVDRVLSGGIAFFSGPAPASALPGLSPRQAQVLELLAKGHGNKEIRHRLGIAERTVRAHLTELFQLLGAHSRTQAIIRARELGLIA